MSIDPPGTFNCSADAETTTPSNASARVQPIRALHEYFARKEFVEQSHAGKGVCAHETLEEIPSQADHLGFIFATPALSQGRANLLFEEIKEVGGGCVNLRPESSGECLVTTGLRAANLVR